MAVQTIRCCVVSLIQSRRRLDAAGQSASRRGCAASAQSSERVVWASGSSNTVLRSDDGGATWKALPRRSPDAARLSRHRRRQRQRRLRAQHRQRPGLADFQDDDAGETWTMQFKNDDADAFFDAMAFWDADHGIAVSDSVNGKFVILMTRDGGQRGRAVPADLAAAGAAERGRVRRQRHQRRRARRSHLVRAPARPRARACCDRSIAARAGRSRTRPSRPARSPASTRSRFATTCTASSSAATTAEGVGGRGQRRLDEQRRQDVDARSTVSADSAPSSRPCRARPRRFLLSGRSARMCRPTTARTWRPVEGPGFDTFSFAPGLPIGWGAGAGGAVGRVR